MNGFCLLSQLVFRNVHAVSPLKCPLQSEWNYTLIRNAKRISLQRARFLDKNSPAELLPPHDFCLFLCFAAATADFWERKKGSKKCRFFLRCATLTAFSWQKGVPIGTFVFWILTTFWKKVYALSRFHRWTYLKKESSGPFRPLMKHDSWTGSVKWRSLTCREMNMQHDI